MKRVFVDSHYWIAITNPKDQWAAKAKSASSELNDDDRLVTTHEVVIEFLNGLSKHGQNIKKVAIDVTNEILRNGRIEVVAQSKTSFSSGFQIFQKRLDKEYSLTDCISMKVMEEKNINEVLTNDHHFEQEGFVILIK